MSESFFLISLSFLRKPIDRCDLQVDGRQCKLGNHKEKVGSPISPREMPPKMASTRRVKGEENSILLIIYRVEEEEEDEDLGQT